MNAPKIKTDDLDRKIVAVQRSTKTAVPFLAPLHNGLRMRFKWYYNWHLNPDYGPLYWIFISLYFLAIMALVRLVFWFFGF